VLFLLAYVVVADLAEDSIQLLFFFIQLVPDFEEGMCQFFIWVCNIFVYLVFSLIGFFWICKKMFFFV